MFSGNIRFVIRLYMLHDYNNVHTNDPIRNISISYRRWIWCWSLDYGGTSSHKSSFDDIINAIIADVWCDIDLTVLKPSTFFVPICAVSPAESNDLVGYVEWCVNDGLAWYLKYSISQEMCTRFLLCCALLWLYIDWFSHIHQAYFTGTMAI